MSPEIGRSKNGNGCSWCLAQFDVEPTPGASSGICQRHLDEVKAQIAARRAKEAGR